MAKYIRRINTVEAYKVGHDNKPLWLMKSLNSVYKTIQKRNDIEEESYKVLTYMGEMMTAYKGDYIVKTNDGYYVSNSKDFDRAYVRFIEDDN